MAESEVKLEFTGERFMPEIAGNIELEHYHRYLLAAEYVKGKNVLDIASGEGYGSYVLAGYADSVVGVDISHEAVAHANDKYKGENIHFRVGDCASIPVETSSVDVVVSFETIEHHDKHEEMISEILRVLKPDGLLIISSPDKAIHSDLTGVDNPYHVKELYHGEFIDLLSTGFKYIAEAGQRVAYGSSILAWGEGESISFSRTDQEIKRSVGLVDAEYIIAFAANVPVPNIKSGIFEQTLESSQVIGAWREEVERRGGRISSLEAELQSISSKHMATLDSMELDIERLQSSLEVSTQELNAAYSRVLELEHRNTELESKINALMNSWSMAITKPLRMMKPVVRFRFFSRERFKGVVLRLWRTIPLGESYRYKVKEHLFKAFPIFFRRTSAYNRWLAFNRFSMSEGGANRDSLISEPRYMPQREFREPANRLARVVCFYLPQYHPIPENDEWWGKGFTEWRNVTRVSPQFAGHYQPKLPGELGFYDLRCPGVFERQIELAKIYGIEAFCFYFYWFGGKRLLESPLLHYLESERLDLPFCLCWANENWTRRWDGLDQEMLIAQSHSPDDDIAFISYVSKYLQDQRYLRIDGRPVLLVYRPGILPDALATTQRWRVWCSENGIGDIYLVCTQSFDKGNPADLGFDAAVEFPPNNAAPPVVTDQVEGLNESFEGSIYDWNAFVHRSRNYSVDDHDYTLFRGVNPGWDNEARKPGRGAVFLGATPDKYQEWLENAVADVRRRYACPDEHMVFVNAWNEWAEGAYLEPDSRYGYSYLQATRNAITSRINNYENPCIAIVSHDAHPHGAQHLALYLCKGFKEVLKYEVVVVLLGVGPLKSEFARYGKVCELSTEEWDDQAAIKVARDLRNKGVKNAICNTTVAGVFVPALKNEGIIATSLIHELPGLIVDNSLEGALQLISDHADRIVFPAQKNLEAVAEIVDFPVGKTIVRPQGVFRHNRYRGSEQRSRARVVLRKKLGLPESSRIVLAVGYADRRKGVDLFLEMASELLKIDASTYFVWVGHHDLKLWPEIEAVMGEGNLSSRVLFQGLDFDTDLYYAGSDIYALTSREDPFPLVALEAMESGLPVVAFSGATGIGDVVADGCGELVDSFNTGAFASAISALMSNEPRRRVISENCLETIARTFSFRRYLFDLESFWQPARKKVTVVVPNYQYEQYIEERLRSIVEQTHPLYELLLLDDASDDNSIAVAEDFLQSAGVEYVLDVNLENSGSVFHQWLKGVLASTGDFIWIAEADDLASSRFLEVMLAKFDEDPDVVLAYSQSAQISSSGELVAADYRDYTNDISQSRWNDDYIVDGSVEAANSFAIKNTIPNVSGVLFRREALVKALLACQEDLKRYRIAGDWRVYVELLKMGKIAFCSEALNSHRRHERSVTLDNFNQRQLDEISSMQAFVADHFDVSADVSKLASSYLSTLKEQFGL